MSSNMQINILIYVLRADLRYNDNPILHEIEKAFNTGTAGFTHLLPIYVFPSHQVEVSGFIPEGNDAASTPNSPYPEARSRVGGFWRCGPHRVKFLAESVWDLKNTLEQKSSRLVIRAGKVTDVLQSAFDHLKAEENPSAKSANAPTNSQIVGVWMTKAYGYEEDREADEVREVVKKNGAEFRSFTDEKYYVHEYVVPKFSLCLQDVISLWPSPLRVSYLAVLTFTQR
jgi:deoxyribodipyrimidine photo-lyase